MYQNLLFSSKKFFLAQSKLIRITGMYLAHMLLKQTCPISLYLEYKPCSSYRAASGMDLGWIWATNLARHITLHLRNQPAGDVLVFSDSLEFVAQAVDFIQPVVVGLRCVGVQAHLVGSCFCFHSVDLKS